MFFKIIWKKTEKMNIFFLSQKRIFVIGRNMKLRVWVFFLKKVNFCAQNQLVAQIIRPRKHHNKNIFWLFHRRII